MSIRTVMAIQSVTIITELASSTPPHLRGVMDTILHNITEI